MPGWPALILQRQEGQGQVCPKKNGRDIEPVSATPSPGLYFVIIFIARLTVSIATFRVTVRRSVAAFALSSLHLVHNQSHYALNDIDNNYCSLILSVTV